MQIYGAAAASGTRCAVSRGDSGKGARNMKKAKRARARCGQALAERGEANLIEDVVELPEINWRSGRAKGRRVV